MTTESVIGSSLLYLAAILTMIARLRPLMRRDKSPVPTTLSKSVSIIIPARNEAQNLPTLLYSLSRLEPPVTEIIVVDDHSTDDTARVARSFGARVITPPPLALGWLGKPWACHHGAAAATGDLLLFADADTAFAPNLVARACERMQRTRASLLSVVPTHVVVAAWERIQGPFHLLLLIATRAGSPVLSHRLFAIGQFLLFRRSHYDLIGGHAVVRDRVAEDLAFAKLTVARGFNYQLLIAPGALKVRMYPDGFGAFMRGWRRNFREGLSATGPSGVIDVSLAIVAFLGPIFWLCLCLFDPAGPQFMAAIVFFLFFGATTLVSAWSQQTVGNMSAVSALAYPVFVLIFVGISVLAFLDRIRRAPVIWRGRSLRLPTRVSK